MLENRSFDESPNGLARLPFIDLTESWSPGFDLDQGTLNAPFPTAGRYAIALTLAFFAKLFHNLPEPCDRLAAKNDDGWSGSRGRRCI